MSLANRVRLVSTRSTIIAIFLGLPAISQAALIQYDFFETDPDAPNFTLTGEIVIDDSHFTPSQNLVPLFDSWFFSWTNGTETYGFDSANGDTLPQPPAIKFAEFYVSDTTGTVESWRICPNGCTFSISPTMSYNSNHPSIGTSWNYSWSGGYEYNSIGLVGGSIETAPTPQPQTQSVPEPTGLALFAGGVIAFGVQRRLLKQKKP